jgi:predicted house-cleaning NTP pyrophosphatase (Maf/HAM1 superfamily)
MAQQKSCKFMLAKEMKIFEKTELAQSARSILRAMRNRVAVPPATACALIDEGAGDARG